MTATRFAASRLRYALVMPLVVAVTPLAGAPLQDRPEDDARSDDRPGVSSEVFGTLVDGREVERFTLRLPSGELVKICEYGATITELRVRDRDGSIGNVVLGFDRLEPYTRGHPLFGATVGRFANRIRGGRFPLDGETVQVTRNAGEHHIHGGREGFHRKLWTGRIVAQDPPTVELGHVSADGEEGFPGRLDVKITFSWATVKEGRGATLRIEYRATTTRPTIVNLTNHSYFNLAGRGDVREHRLSIAADRYTLSDRSLIPTGALASVDGTPLDFRKPHAIGERIESLYESTGGYDHNFVLRGEPGVLREIARCIDPASGRSLVCETTEPGVQLYSANWSDARHVGIDGVAYGRHAGFCLETQHFPDAPNHPDFPSTVVRPDAPFHSTTAFRFEVARSTAPDPSGERKKKE